MTTTSGSPTQNKTVAENANGLQGVPDDAFAEGDLGYVSDLWPDATFRLARRTPPSPPNGTTILATKSGNGYWELFSQASSSDVPSVARVEDLRSLQGSETFGSLVYVRSIRSYFQKVYGTASNDDGITIVHDAAEGCSWSRLSLRSLSWEMQSQWYVDATNGDDQNEGTAGSPIASFEEFQRRVQKIRVDTTVFIVRDDFEVLRGVFEGASRTAKLSIKGVPTVKASGSTTVFTAMGPTTNTLATVTCAEIPNLATFVGKMLRANYLGHALTTHIIKNNAGVAVIGGVFSADAIYSYNPLPNGTPIEVISIPAVESVQIDSYSMPMWIYYLRTTISDTTFSVRGTGLFGGQIESCELYGDVDLGSSRFYSGSLFTGSGTFKPFVNPNSGMTYSLFNGCTFIGRDCQIPSGVPSSCQGTIIYQASLILGDLESGAKTLFTSSAAAYSVGVFESPGDAFVFYKGTVAGYRYFFGKDNVGHGMVIKNGAKVIFTDPAYTPKVVGSSDFLFRSGGNQISRLLASANVPAASPVATWGQFNAAPFNSTIMSYQDETVLTASTT